MTDSKTIQLNRVFRNQLRIASHDWNKFWKSGAAIDFTGSTDKRAFELERRIILSQYLTKIQCAGNFPPQETGLTYNSWYGKPHLEMHWWHGIHFAYGEELIYWKKVLYWYKNVAEKARLLQSDRDMKEFAGKR